MLMTPAHMHMRVEVLSSVGISASRTVGAPVIQGAGVAGIHGIGVRTPQTAAYHDGEATSAERHFFASTRNGYIEECYFDYGISPIRGEEDRIVGLFMPATETTHRVLARRRGQLLHDRQVLRLLDAAPHAHDALGRAQIDRR